MRSYSIFWACMLATINLLETIIKIENDSDEDPFCPSPHHESAEIFISAHQCSSQAKQIPKRLHLPAIPSGVTGFNFPIADELTTERLEAAVRNDAKVREEYINFLQVKKPKSVKIVKMFRTLFSDAALMNYNFSGLCHKGISLESSAKKAFKDYAIFWDCMLEAWQDHGIDSNVLRESLKLVKKNVHKRKRSRKYMDKIKQKKIKSS
ncbi:uncharacterized protein LOC120418372 [Culex pipiens pallens]|uniref:uncharacterized protein LOC120418372 n=1 Tax=Culex pipiens pallens TaxID=42434 RepID=UPI0022AAFCAA|nr:uncharacterized protein LOC120418372 [Culex pipiens pallens]